MFIRKLIIDCIKINKIAHVKMWLEYHVNWSSAYAQAGNTMSEADHVLEPYLRGLSPPRSLQHWVLDTPPHCSPLKT